MVTGPQSMPVFNDANISPEEKQSIISYLKYVEAQPSPGGLALGSLGPVTEGLFAWRRPARASSSAAPSGWERSRHERPREALDDR